MTRRGAFVQFAIGRFFLEKIFSGLFEGAVIGLKKRKTFLQKGIDKRGGAWYNTEEKEAEQPFSPDRH